MSILTTDKAWARDSTAEFQNDWVREHLDEDGQAWTGEIAYSHTILLDSDLNVV